MRHGYTTMSVCQKMLNHNSDVSFFLSIYPASPSREDYVQLCASKKSMIEES